MKLNAVCWSLLLVLVFCGTIVFQAETHAQVSLSAIEPLDSGQIVSGFVPASTMANNCLVGPTQHKIEIVSGDKRLTLQLTGNLSTDQNTGLYVRRNAPVAIEDGKVISDFKTTAVGTSRKFSLPSPGAPPLQQGSYFIAIVNCATAAINYTLAATISDPTDADIVDLFSLDPIIGSIPVPVPGNCGIGRTQYKLTEGSSTCGGGIVFNVTIIADQNVNVLIRKDRPVTVENGVFMYDRASDNQVKVHHLGGFQQILGPGTYFIAVLNCGFEPVNYTVSQIILIGDPLPFSIFRVTLKKKKLHVAGLFLRGATVLIDGQPQETFAGGVDENQFDLLIVKDAKKKIPRNQPVRISAVRVGGCSSNDFIFIR
ncbi:MAG: hypothetical protein WBV94_25645 [Blastocatellia bacterium]